MTERFSRTEMLIGEDGMKRLANARVAVFGVGGVGGYTVEALARSGVGAIDIVDNDTVSVSNINRQIIAAESSIGRLKVDVMRERILDINPACEVRAFPCFYLDKTADSFNFKDYDYIVDAVDTVTAKLLLAVRATEENVPIISSMGAGNKLNPAAFLVADIYDTSVCPLAKVMRRELKKRGVERLKVVYSKEEPRRKSEGKQERTSEGSDSASDLSAAWQTVSETADIKRMVPGSVAFVPSVVGLILASEVVRDISGIS